MDDPCLLQDGKFCCSDDTLPDGFNVSVGDNVAYLPYPMGRMQYLWGDDAEVFRPERWLNDDGVFQPESPFKFTAFQVGRKRLIFSDALYSYISGHNSESQLALLTRKSSSSEFHVFSRLY